MLRDWTVAKLEAVKECRCVLVRDWLHLLPEADGVIHHFAKEYQYTVIVAATNLVFRELYERAIADPETKKLLVIDRTPLRRLTGTTGMKAPPPFYPDLLAKTPREACINLDLRQFLKEMTGDSDWPIETNEPHYARLIAKHLEGVLRAHQNLRAAHPKRFTNYDFKTIVAFATLGVSESAFKKLDTQDYWRIGLLSHQALEDLDLLVPEVTKPLKETLWKAPAPFCWFGKQDTSIVLRAFYLSVILAQHVEHWHLLVANIDPSLASLTQITTDILWNAAPKLIALDPQQARRDLEEVEQALNSEALHFLLLQQLDVTSPQGFTSALEKERYSLLVRSLALLLAVDHLLVHTSAPDEYARIAAHLFPPGNDGGGCFVDTRSSVTWSHVKEAYRLAYELQHLREELSNGVKVLSVMKTESLTFAFFWELWNEKRVNRLEYYLSTLRRLVESGELLPRAEDEVPSAFVNALTRIRKRTTSLVEEVNGQLDEVNRRFQDMVAVSYPSWIARDSEVYLTSQFLRRCVKRHWDPQRERAVVLVFDGMRYDMWDEFLRPMIEDRLELLETLPASALLPSETGISRWGLAAGQEPRQFLPAGAENEHLKDALLREFHYQGNVEVIAPEGSGTGETVRYRAGGLDYYIFEFCDKELHKISMKTLSDGRKVPGRPLSFIYQQHIKNIIDTEVMAIIRRLAPGTKVFVTADHGFGPVGREAIWFEQSDLNDATDCSYLNCWLRVPFQDANLPAKARRNIIALTPEQLRLPASEVVIVGKGKQKHSYHKDYKAIVFPRVGYSFSRPGSPYHPDAYTHGGISIQELMIPMVVLRVRSHEEGQVTIDPIKGPNDLVEGEEAVFRLRINRKKQEKGNTEEVRIEIEVTYSRDQDRIPPRHHVLYISPQGDEFVSILKPDRADATEKEIQQGLMERILTISVGYRDGRRLVRKVQTFRFSVRLNSEHIIRRVPANLGNLLGLTPKSMR